MAHHPGRALQESKNSPLAMAIKDCDLARLRELLDGGVDANTRVGAKTALHELCSTRDEATEPLVDEQQRAACVSALLEAGADPNLRPWGSDLDTPLISATSCGFHSIVQLLVAAGADAADPPAEPARTVAGAFEPGYTRSALSDEELLDLFIEMDVQRGEPRMTREEQKAKIMAYRPELPPLRPMTEEEIEFQGDPFRAIEEAVVAAHGHDPNLEIVHAVLPLGNSAHPNPGRTDESDESEPRVGAGPTVARNRPGPRH